MTSAQDEIPERAEPAAVHRETTAMDGRIPAALLDSLAQEFSSYGTDTETDADTGIESGQETGIGTDTEDETHTGT
ncbi:hypothetical protein J7E87_04210 [Streptomyces sp. ISL-1]|uniref:hypothetical protein n=1 Tax=Streptomyces sp. ISL-1 TaxID=2817657 RepID=UPI001BE8219D|nr:hypothetical protein [Streptomyces sp. ISL-1]MBT2388640.1 hypothetical protein [Streptomyces sp. ISL-1]